METGLRRTMLFVPGRDSKMLEKATALTADGLILDLEDAVALAMKAEARALVRDALLKIDYGGRERAVRVNALSTPFGREDVRAIVLARPESILLPKVDAPEDVQELDALMTQIEKKEGLTRGKVKIIALMETPRAIVSAVDIALSSERMTALVFGAGDFVRETHGQITPDRIELLYPLTQIVLAARIAKIDAIDSPFFNVRDLEGLEREARAAARMGFDGKVVLHPGQIAPVNQIFTPSAQEIEHALRVIEAYREAEAEGIGATTLDGHLVETVHVQMANRTLQIAAKAGLLDKISPPQEEDASLSG